MKHNLLDNNIKDIAIALRKKGKADKKDYLVALSDDLDVARRRRTKVNIFKLSILAKRHIDKVFLVPGIVLGYGSVELPINVYALRYSANAVKKIESVKGSAKTLHDLLKDNIENKNVMLIR